MKPKLYKDYIVEEVRRVREDLSAKYDFDVKKMFAAARRRQKKSGVKVVSFTVKKKAS